MNALSPTDLDTVKANILDYKEDLKTFDDLIQNLKFVDVDTIDENELQKETDTCDEYMSKIRECLAIINRVSVSPPRNTYVDIDVTRSLLKQPTAPLPKFSGDENEDLIKFITEFELTTSNYKYPDRDLLLLLLQQLSGKAKILLRSLEADKQNYKDAKDLLVSAFASPEIRKFSSIKRLTELKLGYEDEPFEFISKVKMLCESVKSLNITSDDFLQYFVWEALNKGFQTHLTNITGKTKPSIKEILDNFFTANERYSSDLKSRKYKVNNQNSPKHQKSSSSLAVNVNTKSSNTATNCSLCSKLDEKECDHSLSRCTKFSNPKVRIEKINQLKGCVKCGYMNHVTQQCKFKFQRKCRHCSKWHFEFLCPQWSTGSQKSKLPADDSKVVHTEASSGIVVLPSVGCDSLLSTFSFTVHNEVFRGLIDRGSQSSFVSESLATSHNLKILQSNVKLTVHGFNKQQNYLSRLVELPIRLGGLLHVIPCLVVPQVKVDLKLPQLGSVIEAFLQKGYVLADSNLNKNSISISNIDFLLGSDAARCLAGRDICFGKQSMYIESSGGVLLLGNVTSILQDLPYLPRCRSVARKSFSAICSTGDSASQENSKEGVSSLENGRKFEYHTHSFFVSNFVNSLENEEMENLDFKSVSTHGNLSVIDNKGKLIESQIQKATDQILESECDKYINYDSNQYNDESVEVHNKLVDYTLDKMSHSEEGRIVVPLLWNGKVSQFLAKNQNLSKMILKSNLKKLKRNGYLNLVDNTIKEQVSSGIISKIENLDEYLAEHPEYSFLPHMSIIKPDRETTKCRIVFLSNLSETNDKKRLSLSHNQAMFAGPCLNQKLSSALMQLRFGRYLLTYDLKKAFNQLLLSETDQSKLLFYWFNNIEKNDFSLVAYKNVRLSFGLKCSPFLLMISLYYILVCQSKYDNVDLRNLKQLMYSLLYMDNGAITADSKDELQWAYDQLGSIFSPYSFNVQQLTTNDLDLQNSIHQNFDENPSNCVKLFGLIWNRTDDTIYTKPISLNKDATTKRSILKSIAAQFDIYNFNMPVLNRSRIFMHSLQCSKAYGWDDKLAPDLLREWGNICKQANSTPAIEIPRFVGPRKGTYRLIAFTDASHCLYGSVIYIQHVESGKISFLSAKNRMISHQLKHKSIPSLELNAITLGLENLIDIYRDLSGPSCLKPLRISELRLYTDSLCCLHWLNQSTNKFDNMQRHTVFVRNRLQTIVNACENYPVTFSFISGSSNPADCVTRCVSYKQLVKTSFLSGPNLEFKQNSGQEFDVKIPNPLLSSKLNVGVSLEKSQASNSNPTSFSVVSSSTQDPLLNPSNFSSFRHLVLLYRRILVCAKTWQEKAGVRSNLSTDNYFEKASKNLILEDQRRHFPDVIQYFDSTIISKSSIPAIVSQVNIFKDKQGILRVKSKFKKWQDGSQNFPILLSSNSDLTKLIILDTHSKLSHSGIYSVLGELRKKFYIPKHFSTAKKYLRKCTHCQRFNARVIKLNQSSYRDFRTDPPKIPFSNVFVDHLGPLSVKINNETKKVWLLCITCTWTRAVNLKICLDLSLKEFLRAFQIHVFEYGVPQLCISDLGSQLSAGVNLLKDYLNDHEVQIYFESNNIKPLEFQQYFKGCSALGSLVEICVKLVKRLIFGSIKNNILEYHDFEFLIYYVVHLINRRPIAFKEALRDPNLDTVPEPITPEHLIRGYELTSINIIPDLQDVPSSDPDWSANLNASIKDQYKKLRKVRSDLINIYQNEFLGTLISQAVDRKDRYKAVNHKYLRKGDIVLLKETNIKPNHYPLAIVKELVINDLNEVTGAIVFKGKTRELVKRHASTLIPLLEVSGEPNQAQTDKSGLNDLEVSVTRPSRNAAIISRQRTKAILDD